MRVDKFTTKLQEALAQAQSLALGQDNQYIEPQHLLAALLEDEGIGGLIAKAGGNANALKKSVAEAISGLPKVEGTPGEVHLSRELAQLLNVADKEAQKRGDQYIASELFLLAAAGDKGETGRMLKSAGVTKAALEKGHEIFRVFFYHDGVNNGTRLTVPPQDDRNLQQCWTELGQKYNLDLVVCIAAAQRRGILDESEAKRQGKDANNIAPGFRISGLGQLIEAGIEADRLVVFGD